MEPSREVEWRGTGKSSKDAVDEASGNGGIRGHILLDDVLVNR